ncbi:MAG TPA: DinB family protein [Vicinamibacterales bacterium]|nr:DinB family protein [Vicinamibacterales bacterium]
MSKSVSTAVAEKSEHSSQPAASRRAEALAERLEQGARMLADFATTLTDAEWKTRLPKDSRKIGTIVHHVASQYMLEIKVALMVVSGQPITGLTNADVDAVNAAHAKEFENATKAQALELLAQNSADAAATIRGLADEELDRAVPNSLYEDAPITCQMVLEDHAVRHSYHHLWIIRKFLGR